MRRDRFTVTILAAALVVLVTIASLLTAALATYLTVRGGDYLVAHNLHAGFFSRLYQPAGVALLVAAALSAALCSLLWRTFPRPLGQIVASAPPVRDESYGKDARRTFVASPPVPQDASPEVTTGDDSVEAMARLLREEVAARRKSETMLSTILDAVPYGIWWKDPNGVYLGCNSEFVAAAGCQDPGQIIGKTDYDLPWPRDEATAYRADDRAVLASNRPKRHIVEPITHANGEIHWADTTKVPLTDAGGAPYGVLGVAEDITERKVAEDALRREKELTEAIFDNLPVVIHLYDDQGRLVRWNARATELSGFSDEDLRLRPIAHGRTGEDWAGVASTFERTMREGRATLETYLMTKGGGRGIPVLIVGVRVTLDGRPHVLAIGVDITERQRAEQQLRCALRDAESANFAKDRFLAAVSHELRTPLAPVLFLSSSLESDARLPADARRDMADIREHAEIEKRLIGDLLDFSAIHAGKLQIHAVPADVHDILHAAIRTCQAGIDRKRIRLDVRLDARRHHTHGDPDRLRQVFWNLIQNACKFTPEEQAIFVRTGDDEDGRTIRVEIADSGVGMTAETLRRVFQPFEQGPQETSAGQARGLGLGLAISKSLVEAHGGSITAASEGVGRGSTFVVRLPVAAEGQVAGVPARAGPTSAVQPPLRLLLVEDHPLTLKILGRLLSSAGHEVTTATTIDGALRAAAERAFDLVISDLTLPDGSGLDLMPVLRDRYGVPGIALSGSGAESDIEASRRAGFLAHLVKPVTPEALAEQIDVVVRKARDRDAAVTRR